MHARLSIIEGDITKQSIDAIVNAANPTLLIKTIGFPCISTGVYGFPIARAARVALGEIGSFLDATPAFDRARIVCFGQRAYETHVQAAQELGR